MVTYFDALERTDPRDMVIEHTKEAVRDVQKYVRTYIGLTSNRGNRIRVKGYDHYLYHTNYTKNYCRILIYSTVTIHPNTVVHEFPNPLTDYRFTLGLQMVEREKNVIIGIGRSGSDTKEGRVEVIIRPKDICIPTFW